MNAKLVVLVAKDVLVHLVLIVITVPKIIFSMKMGNVYLIVYQDFTIITIRVIAVNVLMIV